MISNNKTDTINVRFSQGYSVSTGERYEGDVWEVTLANEVWVYDQWTNVIETYIPYVGVVDPAFGIEEDNRYWKGVETVITVKRFGPAGWAFSDEDSIPLCDVWNALVNPPAVFVESDEDLPF